MYVQPYKRHDMNVLAIVCQITLLAFFTGAVNIKLHSLLEQQDSSGGMHLAEEITGFEDAASLGAVIFGFNLLGAALFLAMTAYQVHMRADVRSLRLVRNHQRPELKLQHGHTWHLFLSHIWSSGQDQVPPPACRCLRYGGPLLHAAAHDARRFEP